MPKRSRSQKVAIWARDRGKAGCIGSSTKEAGQVEGCLQFAVAAGAELKADNGWLGD